MLFFYAFLTICVSGALSHKYLPDWDDLDKRPLPEWYDKAKIGIFIHWGVYSVPSFGGEWFWNHWVEGSDSIKNFMKANYPPNFTYQDFGPQLTAEFFDADKWADLFQKAGAKYIVLTTKHHEGYTLFPSKRSFSWNSVDVGPHRDLVAELSAAVRKKDIQFGAYYSLYEWYNPLYLEDKNNYFETRNYVETKMWPEVLQLINDYKPSILWSDGDWDTVDKYWNSTGLLAWLYNDSPVKNEIVVNDRWGIGSYCKHGDFYNCKDRYSPGVLQNHKWENAFTLAGTWGYTRDLNINYIMSLRYLLFQVISTVSCGGNALINVGPTKEGTIPTIFQERLLQLGVWLSINGEAIYNTSPWLHQNDTLNGDIWYTCLKHSYNAQHPTAIPGPDEKVAVVYAMFLTWPENNILIVKDIADLLATKNNNLYLLINGVSQIVKWEIKNDIAYIKLPQIYNLSFDWAWTLKIILKD